MLVIWWMLVSLESKTYKEYFHKAGGTKMVFEYVSDLKIVNWCLKYEENFMLSLINCLDHQSRLAELNRKDFLDMNATVVLLEYSKHIDSLPDHRIATYVAIAYLASDKEVEILSEIELVVIDLIKLIKQASDKISGKNVFRRVVEVEGVKKAVCGGLSLGGGCVYHLIGIIDALYKLAVNDSIKTKIFKDHGCREYLKQIIINGNTGEREYVTKLLWQLSFNRDISTDIKDDRVLFDFISKLSNDTDGSDLLQKNCKGILIRISVIDKPKQQEMFDATQASRTEHGHI